MRISRRVLRICIQHLPIGATSKYGPSCDTAFAQASFISPTVFCKPCKPLSCSMDATNTNQHRTWKMCGSRNGHVSSQDYRKSDAATPRTTHQPKKTAGNKLASQTEVQAQGALLGTVERGTHIGPRIEANGVPKSHTSSLAYSKDTFGKSPLQKLNLSLGSQFPEMLCLSL